MNNEQIKKLALDLYAADKEEVVVKILEKNKLWDRSKWQILGGDRQATSIANAQQDNPLLCQTWHTTIDQCELI